MPAGSAEDGVVREEAGGERRRRSGQRRLGSSGSTWRSRRRGKRRKSCRRRHKALPLRRSCPSGRPGTPTEQLVAALLDESAATPIFDRYRALFSLRDAGGAQAVSALCAALRGSTSALLSTRWPTCWARCRTGLAGRPCRECLRDAGEHGMVRHEAAEALGALGAEAAVPRWRRGPPRGSRRSAVLRGGAGRAGAREERGVRVRGKRGVE